MIKNKLELEHYIREDLNANLSTTHLSWKKRLGYRLYKNESYMVVRLLRALRYHEYYTNMCSKHNTIINKILLRYYTIKHHRLEIKYGIKLGVNVLGYGVYIPHINGGLIADCTSIGNYCSLNNGVIIGRNHTIENSPIIGDHVNICVGSKIVRKVTIGNNVIVAPNSVVIEDVPDNCIVSGVPAKIVKKLHQ